MCVHHFELETFPENGRVKGVCVKCGEVKYFPTDYDSRDFGGRGYKKVEHWDKYAELFRV